MRDTLQKEYTLQEGVDHPSFFMLRYLGLSGWYSDRKTLVSFQDAIPIRQVDRRLSLFYNISLRVNQYSINNTLVGIHPLILTEEILISIHQETSSLMFITQYLKT